MTARLVAIGFAVAVVLTPAVMAAARRLGLLDRPQPRSSHARVTPRGGGVALVVAAMVCLALAWPRGTGWGAEAAVIAGSLLVAGLGLLDDWASLSPGVRLVGQTAAATLVVAVAGSPRHLPLPHPLDLPLGPLAGVVAVVWIVAVVNFYNFLDGIDGLAAVQGAVTGLGVLVGDWHPLASAAGAALLGACSGFLVFNWSPARIFMGDVGSGFLGFVFAALPLLAPPALKPRAMTFVALSLWLFLADATFTLGWRVYKGRRWHEAHREHLYQHLVINGRSHRGVTALIGAGSVLLTALALLHWWHGGPATTWVAMAVAALLFGAEAWMARLGGRRYDRLQGQAS